MGFTVEVRGREQGPGRQGPPRARETGKWILLESVSGGSGGLEGWWARVGVVFTRTGWHMACRFGLGALCIWNALS
jgi:hypothetical protein